MEEIAAKIAVMELVHRYADAIVTGDRLGCANLFHRDGSFEICQAPGTDLEQATRLNLLEGRDAILAYLEKSTGSVVKMCPMIHNLIVTVDGDKAVATSVMQGASFPAGHEVVGRYRDECVREDGQWLFSKRRYVMMRQTVGEQ